MGLKLQGFLDPLQEGAPTLQEGAPTYKIARFSQKNCMKLRNFWSVGGRPFPLGSPTAPLSGIRRVRAAKSAGANQLCTNWATVSSMLKVLNSPTTLSFTVFTK